MICCSSPTINSAFLDGRVGSICCSLGHSVWIKMQLDLPGREFGLGSVRQNTFIFSSYRSWNPQPFCDTGFQLGRFEQRWWISAEEWLHFRGTRCVSWSESAWMKQCFTQHGFPTWNTLPKGSRPWPSVSQPWLWDGKAALCPSSG